MVKVHIKTFMGEGQGMFGVYSRWDILCNQSAKKLKASQNAKEATCKKCLSINNRNT